MSKVKETHPEIESFLCDKSVIRNDKKKKFFKSKNEKIKIKGAIRF